jgi:hypothetical protein
LLSFLQFLFLLIDFLLIHKYLDHQQ